MVPSRMYPYAPGGGREDAGQTNRWLPRMVGCSRQDWGGIQA